MFGFIPTTINPTPVRKSSKRDILTSAATTIASSSSPESLEPAIDGPPSPERIRAYTEQMKRSSIFGNNSRTNTFSSATSSSRSRESTATSNDNLSLSRRSSNRSNTSSMPSVRSERPESVAIFGSIFSRAGRKARRNNDAASVNCSASPPVPGHVGEDSFEEGSAKQHYYGKGRDPRKRQLISGPYNFQHVTHTRQDHLPNLELASRMELVSEFSAIRASQSPLVGELKGIRAADLHFENFSSEALVSQEPAANPPKSPRHRTVLRKSISPPQPQRTMTYAKSHENLRGAPPPRPPRSDLLHTLPAVPARTSSRTASILFDSFDPLGSTTIERPKTSAGFRKPTPFHLPTPPPPPPSWREQHEDNSDRPMSHALTTPGDESWPLTASPTGTFGDVLADVQEEDEEVVSRRSKISIASTELRMSQSVPALRRMSYEQGNKNPEHRMSTTLGRSPSGETVVPQKAPLSPGFQFVQDTWEDDIDYCYEHEVEADCDYQWDRCSVGEDKAAKDVTPYIQLQPQAPLELHLQDNERVYHGRYRPSLLTPCTLDLPELSPLSASTTSSDPRTPSNFLRPSHLRSPSQASSFKESHGFNLSPSLLIPVDFQSQLEQEDIYHEHYSAQSGSASIFLQDQYQHSASSIDEGASSTASYRSSNFSRGSARSSSSTRMSGGNSRSSQDSMVLLKRAANLSGEHRSVGSATSLPDLIPSTAHQSAIDLSANAAALRSADRNADSAPAPEIAGPAPTLASLQHRRNKSLVLEQGLRKGVNHFPPSFSQSSQNETANPNSMLSPVDEGFPLSPSGGPEQGIVHGRKTSAPTMSSIGKDFKGRARAATSAASLSGGKRRGSYMIFPQV